MALSIAKLGQAHIPGRIALGNCVPAHIQPLRACLRNVLPLMVPRQAIARGGQKALRFLLRDIGGERPVLAGEIRPLQPIAQIHMLFNHPLERRKAAHQKRGHMHGIRLLRCMDHRRNQGPVLSRDRIAQLVQPLRPCPVGEIAAQDQGQRGLMLRIVKAGNLPCRALSRFRRDEWFGELEAARQPLQNGLGNLCATGGQCGLPGLGAGEFRDGVHGRDKNHMTSNR